MKIPINNNLKAVDWYGRYLRDFIFDKEITSYSPGPGSVVEEPNSKILGF
ncbi:protein of unknown function [Candidatus Nitrosacidococcus tergens]|uniref:Uncharacterized protein n=1 Tax=Candidatus Nitrosacidococcus tergens TaxID=553981 RepID=A0A7G1QB72_9GAMM|nr:protein of unknown function [Candidatus Nitrosacidococcus tergens]